MTCSLSAWIRRWVPFVYGLLHTPLLHTWGAVQALAPPQPHAPSMHMFARAGSHTVHVEPRVPQVNAVAMMHVSPEQQPDGQLAAVHVPSQMWSALQSLGLQLSHARPAVPQRLLAVPTTQLPVRQHPSGQLSPSQMHAPFSHRSPLPHTPPPLLLPPLPHAHVPSPLQVSPRIPQATHALPPVPHARALTMATQLPSATHVLHPEELEEPPEDEDDAALDEEEAPPEDEEELELAPPDDEAEDEDEDKLEDDVDAEDDDAWLVAPDEEVPLADEAPDEEEVLDADALDEDEPEEAPRDDAAVPDETPGLDDDPPTGSPSSQRGVQLPVSELLVAVHWL